MAAGNRLDIEATRCAVQEIRMRGLCGWVSPEGPCCLLAWFALTTWCDWLKEQGARGTGEVMTGNLRLAAPAGPMWIAPGETARLIVPHPIRPLYRRGTPKDEGCCRPPVASRRELLGRSLHRRVIAYLLTFFTAEPLEVEPSLRPAQFPSHRSFRLHRRSFKTSPARQALRTRHYSYRTEQAYVPWIKRFSFLHKKRHPKRIGLAVSQAHHLVEAARR